jgi:hypothetical protein
MWTLSYDYQLGWPGFASCTKHIQLRRVARSDVASAAALALKKFSKKDPAWTRNFQLHWIERKTDDAESMRAKLKRLSKDK